MLGPANTPHIYRWVAWVTGTCEANQWSLTLPVVQLDLTFGKSHLENKIVNRRLKFIFSYCGERVENQQEFFIIQQILSYWWSCLFWRLIEYCIFRFFSSLIFCTSTHLCKIIPQKELRTICGRYPKNLFFIFLLTYSAICILNKHVGYSPKSTLYRGGSVQCILLQVVPL